MQRTQNDTSIPRPLLIGAALLMGSTLVLASFAHQYGADDNLLMNDTRFEGVDLRFEDRADGAVLVIDAADDQPLTTLEPGTNGFIRSVLRGLVSERTGGDDVYRSAFRLQRTADGNLMIGDPVTGREVHLAAFGAASVAAFEQLMPARDQPR